MKTKIYGSEKTALVLTAKAKAIYASSDPLTIAETEREDGTVEYSISGIIERDGLTAEEANEAIEALEETDEAIHVQFEAGQSRRSTRGVNFMLSDDRRIYAEIEVPDGASEDYGYLTMKKAILEAWTGEPLKFWYDGQEHYLSKDANADAPVYLEIETDN